MGSNFEELLNSGKTPQDAISIPGLAPGSKGKTENPFDGYKVKILKCNLDEPGELLTLTTLMTRGIDGTGNVIIKDVDKYSFQSSFFVILTYLEKQPNAKK